MRIQPPVRKARVSRRTLVIAGAAIIGALIALGAVATFYTDLLWFRETGFTEVFWGQIRVKLGLGLVFGAIFAVALLVNLWVVRRVTSPHRVFSLEDQVLERYRASLRPYVRWAVIGVAILFGIFAGSGASGQWRTWMQFSNATDFGINDPIFSRDIGFYIFRLPFHRFVFTWAFSSLFVITFATAVAHYLMGGIRIDQRGGRATPQVKAHVSVLLGLLVLLKAWGYRLDQLGLLQSPRGRVTGASYTDVNAHLPALKLLVIMAIIVAVLFFVNVRVRGWTIPIAGIGLIFLTSILAGGAYPALVQRLRVTPVERTREAPFIKRNIEATRAAFGIDDDAVTVRPFPGTSDIDKAAIARNRTTIENIRLWNPEILQDSFRQLQRVKQYYEFLDVDVDRYTVGGTTRQVMLTAREMDQSELTDRAASWLNKHLIYTHGNGIVASRIDKVTAEGRPTLIVQDVPPKATQGMTIPANTRLYFGETEETPYVVVRTDVEELDFPLENTFQGHRYDGKGGIELSGALRRFAFAWRFRDANLLLSSAIKPESRIMFRRTVRDRVQKVAPFLKLDHDPYIVLGRDRLYWVQDAYTTTDMYPYSERVNLGPITPEATGLRGSANYIRNSVKAVVDAVDGSITLYVVDEDDPIIRSWQRVFPKSLKPASAVPAEIRAHFRYPEDLFRVQTDQFQLYHITDPTNFYSKEDAWAIPAEPRPGSIGPIPAFYQLMRLPDEAKPEYVIVRPFTPKGRKNLTAFFVARSDQEHYGELRAYALPRQSVVLGPEQVHGQINQDPAVSQLRTLLGTAGSQFLFGDLLTIPIEQSLLYVQPIYIASTATQLPELKRVVVVSGETVKIGTTLEEALAALFGAPSAAPTEPPTTTTNVAALLAEAQRHYALAQAALRNGDFATYGAELGRMKDALDRAQAAAGPPPSPGPTTGSP